MVRGRTNRQDRQREAEMHQFWNSRLRRALYLWFFALGLGVLGIVALQEFIQVGALSLRRIASLVVVVLINAHALWENISPIAPPVAANGGTLGTSDGTAPGQGKGSA